MSQQPAVQFQYILTISTIISKEFLCHLFYSMVIQVPTIHLQGLYSIIHDPLRHFKQGKIRELYEEAHLVQYKTPKQQAENKAAQAAADVDNFKSANASHQACSSGSYQSRQHSRPGKTPPTIPSTWLHQNWYFYLQWRHSAKVQSSTHPSNQNYLPF